MPKDHPGEFLAQNKKHKRIQVQMGIPGKDLLLELLGLLANTPKP